MTKATHPLQDKVALVTGGSRGLGRAMVERFAGDGAQVVFTYRSAADAADDVVRTVQAAGGQARAVAADLVTVEGVRALFDQLGDEKLDILVLNAGIIEAQEIHDIDESTFDAIFDLNVKSVFFAVQAALDRMADHGRIVLLGSGLTRFVMTEYVVYSAAKSALMGLAKGLAQQLGPRGITVNVLAPGAIDTDMNPWLRTEQGAATMRSMTALDRVGHAADVADVAAFLASPDSRWVTGQRIEASGGQRL